LLGGVLGARRDAEQRQHLSDGDGGPHRREVDGGAGGVGLRLHLFVACLAHLLAAFTCLDEFAVAFGMDGFVVAKEFVLGGDIADG